MVWGRGGWAIVVDLSALCVHTTESTHECGETGEAGHGGCFFNPFLKRSGRDEMIQAVFTTLPTTRDALSWIKSRKTRQKKFSTLNLVAQRLLRQTALCTMHGFAPGWVAEGAGEGLVWEKVVRRQVEGL